MEGKNDVGFNDDDDDSNDDGEKYFFNLEYAKP